MAAGLDGGGVLLAVATVAGDEALGERLEEEDGEDADDDEETLDEGFRARH